MSLLKTGGGGQNRRPSLRGRLIFRVQRGQEVVTKWPPKMNKKRRTANKEREEFFRQVQWAWKYSDPNVSKNYTEAVKGTPLLPRDLFLSANAGRLLAIRTPEGALIVSVEGQANVSETLDFLSSLPGSILIRGEDEWIGLAPGTVDQVLTMDDAGEFPEWADAGGGGGGQETLLPMPKDGRLRFNTGVNHTAGTSIALTNAWATSDLTIHKIWLGILGTPSGTYRGVIYDWCPIGQLPASTAGAVLVATTAPKVLVNGPSYQSLDFALPVALPKDRVYLVGYHKTGAAIQTSFASLNETKTLYSSTTVFALPPNPAPAFTIGTNAGLNYFTD